MRKKKMKDCRQGNSSSDKEDEEEKKGKLI